MGDSVARDIRANAALTTTTFAAAVSSATANTPPAHQGSPQRSIGQPEIPLRLYRLDDGADLVARVRKELEQTDQHAVVAKQHLHGDALAQ